MGHYQELKVEVPDAKSAADAVADVTGTVVTDAAAV